MKRIIIFALTAAMAISAAQAQFTDKLVPHFGYMYTMVTMDGTNLEEGASANYSFNTLGLGTYYTIKHHNDWASFGIDPSINLGLNLSNGSGQINWFTQGSLFFMGRLGANSTKYNTQKIGIGAGIGGVASYLDQKALNGAIDMESFFLNPAAVGEITLNMRGSTLTGRVQLSLSPAVKEGDLVTQDGNFLLQNREAKFGTIGLGLIYGF
ncbi:hypothetical protein N9933_03540 [bacterium]|nr:hypothetical protein [bacterium]